jgi:hypothetical protein
MIRFVGNQNQNYFTGMQPAAIKAIKPSMTCKQDMVSFKQNSVDPEAIADHAKRFTDLFNQTKEMYLPSTIAKAARSALSEGYLEMKAFLKVAPEFATFKQMKGIADEWMKNPAAKCIQEDLKELFKLKKI